MTPIASMVSKMLATGVAHDVIILAVETAEQCASSGGIPVEKALENRREYDRNRKRLKKLSGGIPVESGGIPKDALSFLSKASIKEENKKERASRIPPDWKPSAADRQMASEQGCSEAEINSEALGFVDFWKAKPGKDGVKLDWSATWRNRIRAFATRTGKTPAAHIADPDNPYLDPKHPQFEDYKHGWRPGMPTSAEMRAKRNGGEGNTGITVASVDARRNGAGPPNQGLAFSGARLAGGHGMDGLFREVRLDPDDSS